MVYEYEGLDGTVCSEELVVRKVTGFLLHSTPDENVPAILKEGLKCEPPTRTKQLLDIPAIFCSIPGAKSHTGDLFRSYDDWSVIVINTDVLLGHVWYEDFLADPEMRNRQRLNNHVFKFADIPKNAIHKVIRIGR